MIPFRLTAQPGVPVCEQAVYAATRAIVTGQMRMGDSFPSVRLLSRELKINPNTAHKVISQLLSDGLIESRPGIGTIVAKRSGSSLTDRAALLNRRIEELIVEAKRLSVGRDEVIAAIEKHWHRLSVRQETCK